MVKGPADGADGLQGEEADPFLELGEIEEEGTHDGEVALGSEVTMLSPPTDARAPTPRDIDAVLLAYLLDLDHTK